MRVLKTRTCPLCDEALAQLRRKQRRLGLAIEVQDITDDAKLMELHGQEVPVVFIEGRRRFFGRVDPVLLRRTVTLERRRLADEDA